MRKNKRWISLLLAVLTIATLLAGCRSGDESAPKPKPSKNNAEVVEKPSRNNNKEMDTRELAKYCSTRVVRVNSDDGHGSGFFIDDEGTLVTNFHVIEGTKSLSIQLDGGASYPVTTIVNFDPYYDIAILKADISGNDYFEMTNNVELGEPLYVSGYPKDVTSASFTSGEVSEVTHMKGLKECIQTSAPINPGNSGGPAVNGYGQVMGICTMKRLDAENMGYAIKSSVLDKMGSDKNFDLSRFSEWDDLESSRSCWATDNGEDYYKTYVHTYTTVTGVDCEETCDDDLDRITHGYAAGEPFYAYPYDMENHDAYRDYLYEIGFKFVQSDIRTGAEGWEYTDNYENFNMVLIVDTTNKLLYISCPVYY